MKYSKSDEGAQQSRRINKEEKRECERQGGTVTVRAYVQLMSSCKGRIPMFLIPLGNFGASERVLEAAFHSPADQPVAWANPSDSKSIATCMQQPSKPR